ncbi:50S ribosomal protein L11 methyltransferase [Gilvimarinus algae]|uniref:Ribosomal protein L11 methyltransferase n=1 Tax=Gilvimarinus algae TaxID=3058037 RepID=A0ABT8TFN6_9GAMM|nr:50S ribosomal protein L11 methyltransferase [Gilvimarinus sp. SDUM040014]MDO3382889.1 50S ribosomal protein L11 methyltransferase [Gilvimarinus sp. SDUM040014]
MPWLQLKLTTSRRNAATVEDALLDSGAVSVTLEDNADQPILEPALGETPLWDQVKITGLYEADIDTHATTAAIAQNLTDPLPEHRWEQLEDKDWEREWMNNYHPIRCAENLWICPSWCEPPEPDKVNILLDPGLAFGTGTHPTTFLCLEWLAGAELDSKTLIDYGCGSGILGIAALKLGARRVIGVDIDPQALLATADNAARNHLPADAMPVYLPKDAPTASADLVLANILAGPLAELAPTLTQLTRPGGRLCLSGILASQAQTVMAAYAEHFDFDPIAQKDEWVRLTGRKTR